MMGSEHHGRPAPPGDVALPEGVVIQREVQDTTESSQSTCPSGVATTTKNVSPVEGLYGKGQPFLAELDVQAVHDRMSNQTAKRHARAFYTEEKAPWLQAADALVPDSVGTTGIEQGKDPVDDGSCDSPTLGRPELAYNASALVMDTNGPVEAQPPHASAENANAHAVPPVVERGFGGMHGVGSAVSLPSAQSKEEHRRDWPLRGNASEDVGKGLDEITSGNRK